MPVGDEQKVGTRGGQTLTDLRPVAFSGRTRECPGNLQTRVETRQRRGRALRHAGGRAEVEDAPPLYSRPFAQAVNCVGTGHAFVEAYPCPPRGPQHADPVRRTEIGCGQRPAEDGAAARFDDELRVDGADLACRTGGVRLPAAAFILRTVDRGQIVVLSLLALRSRLLDPAADKIKSPREIDAVDSYAQNSHRL